MSLDIISIRVGQCESFNCVDCQFTASLTSLISSTFLSSLCLFDKYKYLKMRL